MTQTNNRLVDEFAKLATDAAAVAQGVRREAEAALRAQAERIVSELDMVPREEHEAVKEMAANALDEVERLKGEMSSLEARLAALEAAHRPGAVHGDGA